MYIALQVVLEHDNYVFIYRCIFENQWYNCTIREIWKYFEPTHGVHWKYIGITIDSSRMLRFHGKYPNLKFHLKQNIHCRDLSKLTRLQMIGYSKYTVRYTHSISQTICTRFCCALLCCGYAIVHNEFTWSIHPYSSGLLCWHWGNR